MTIATQRGRKEAETARRPRRRRGSGFVETAQRRRVSGFVETSLVGQTGGVCGTDQCGVVASGEESGGSKRGWV